MTVEKPERLGCAWDGARPELAALYRCKVECVREMAKFASEYATTEQVEEPIAERVLFGDIVKALCLLGDHGFQVKELEATPSAFGALVRELQVMSFSNEAPSSCGDDPAWIDLKYYDRSVRIAMKPLLELSLDLPSKGGKVPIPWESPSDG